MTQAKLELVLCWHMHQPEYRDPQDGRYRKPWTWLHGIKDYTDMAAHLETVPGARAVVNFSTILLEQLADCAARIERRLAGGAPIGDPLLDALAGDLPGSADERLALAAACLHANRAHMVEAFPPYAELYRTAEQAVAAQAPLEDGELGELVTWYVLAWTGESVRRGHPPVRELLRRGRGFSPQDRRGLLELVGRELAARIPRYRQLAARGIVELSLTPHAHPILPLLIDHRVAHEAMPEAPLPSRPYPGGRERAEWHVTRALASFERHFGARPAGCWPAEGGVSESTLALLARAGFAWTATGTNVLRHSLPGGAEGAHFRRWHATFRGVPIACFFRDDELSDRIGFEYRSWDAAHAVDDFLARLDAIRREWTGAEPPVVAIIMDGENAWEHFPYNGWFFLQHLYSKLVQQPHVGLTTFGELARRGGSAELPRLTAGSWVYGNFALWIGDDEKNRAWERLGEAKAAADRALATRVRDAAAREAVLEQLAVCEASDWFWWLGGDNDPAISRDFDEQFRRQLAGLYVRLGETPPQALHVRIATHTRHSEEAGSMRRAGS